MKGNYISVRPQLIPSAEEARTVDSFQGTDRSSPVEVSLDVGPFAYTSSACKKKTDKAEIPTKKYP